MTEGLHTDERPTEALVTIVRESFGLALGDATNAWAGEESVGWLVLSSDGPWFVQRFPEWRTSAELTWCDDVARAASTLAPESVHASASKDGRRAIDTSDGPVMVFPFVDGSHPDDPRAIADEAAELLARIHRGIAEAWIDPGWRRPPPASPTGPMSHPQLHDPQLDVWEREAVVAGRPRYPIHGDFYGGNLILAGGRIAGVIDWAEARLEHQAQEIGWAVWEFCQNGEGDDLVDIDAVRFLETYAEASGPVDISPPYDPIPWIRQRLRREAAKWFGDPATAQNHDYYHDSQLLAFVALKGRALNG